MATAECRLCPVGSFQTLAGAQHCLACNNSKTTAAPGSTTPLDCKSLCPLEFLFHTSSLLLYLASCPAGQFNNIATGTCQDCGFGFYQPKEGSFSCFACGIGKTTLTATAATADDCRGEMKPTGHYCWIRCLILDDSDECPDGQRLLSSGICHDCPIGSFRTKGLHQTCVPCREGFTTQKNGASRPDQCDTRK